MTFWRRRVAIQETRDRGEDRDHQEGDRAPLDRMKLLAQPPAEVAGTGDAPDMLGSRRHSLRHRLDPGGEAQARLATNTSSIGGSLTREIGTRSRCPHK
jgi:hypothetical protein